jgi:hypothetical protein
LSTLSKASGIVLPALWFALAYLRTGFVIQWKYYIKIGLICLVPAMFFIYKNSAAASNNILIREFNYTVLQHLLFLAYSYMFYIVRWIFPFELSLFYPSPSESASQIEPIFFISAIGVIIIVLLFIYHFKKGDRFSVFLLGSYTIAAIPTLDLILIYSDLPMLVSNRYFYMPGIFVMAYFINLARKKLNSHVISSVLFAGLLLISSLGFFLYLPTWKNTISVLENTVKYNPNEEMMYRLSLEYFAEGRRSEAYSTIKMADTLNMGIWINNPSEFYWKRSLVYFYAGLKNQANADIATAINKSRFGEACFYKATEIMIKDLNDNERCLLMQNLKISQSELQRFVQKGFMPTELMDEIISCITTY